MKIDGIQGSRAILDMFRNVMNPVPYKKPERAFKQEPVKKVAKADEKHKSGTSTEKNTKK